MKRKGTGGNGAKPKSPRTQPEEYEGTRGNRSSDDELSADEQQSLPEVIERIRQSPKFNKISNAAGKVTKPIRAQLRAINRQAAAVNDAVRDKASAVRGAVDRGVERRKQDLKNLVAQIPKSEGWLELFLSPAEKSAFGRWVEEVSDKSINHKITNNIFDKLASMIPSTVGPNMVTLAGLAGLAQAYYVTRVYGGDFSTPSTYAALSAIVFFYITNSVDSK